MVVLDGEYEVRVREENVDTVLTPSAAQLIGQQVRLVDLVGAAHLNGRIGICSGMEHESGVATTQDTNWRISCCHSAVYQIELCA